MRCLQDTARVILALWLVLVPVKAWAGNQTLLGAGGAGAAAATFSLSFVDNQQEASGLTTISYSACANGVSTCNFGATDPNRIIVVCAGARMTTVNAISSMTIGGSSATAVSGTAIAEGGTNGSNSGCYQAAPGGTSGTVSITWGAAAARTGIAIYRIVTSTATANSSDSKASATTITNGTLAIAGGGKGIAFSFQRGTTTAPTWAGATQDYTAVSGSTSEVSGATVSASSSAISAGVNANQVLSLAAWGP